MTNQFGSRTRAGTVLRAAMEDERMETPGGIGRREELAGTPLDPQAMLVMLQEQQTMMAE